MPGALAPQLFSLVVATATKGGFRLGSAPAVTVCPEVPVTFDRAGLGFSHREKSRKVELPTEIA